jgi:hypothetical protein
VRHASATRPVHLVAPVAGTAAVGLLVRAVYRLNVTGALAADLGVGRTVRPLGPMSVTIEAPRDLVFEVIAGPYLGRTPAGLSDEIDVLERGADLVLAAHRTSVGRGLVAITVETVRFSPPERVEFRLVRGPVPHVVESFHLHDVGGTRLDYSGELGTDLWAVGRFWGDQVARRWEGAVAASLDQVKTAAEARAARRAARGT